MSHTAQPPACGVCISIAVTAQDCLPIQRKPASIRAAQIGSLNNAAGCCQRPIRRSCAASTLYPIKGSIGPRLLHCPPRQALSMLLAQTSASSSQRTPDPTEKPANPERVILSIRAVCGRSPVRCHAQGTRLKPPFIEAPARVEHAATNLAQRASSGHSTDACVKQVSLVFQGCEV